VVPCSKIDTAARPFIACRASINGALWDASKGAYKDNPTSTLYPQDGNSLANWFNVTAAADASNVSSYLKSNWGQYVTLCVWKFNWVALHVLECKDC
jgi:hypothetical protein